MKWVTRERPKIDRLACPWLMRRFIDKVAVFRYVPTNQVRAVAAAEGAVPYDIPDVELPVGSCRTFAARDRLQPGDPLLG
jgi:hypothetical protein